MKIELIATVFFVSLIAGSGVAQTDEQRIAMAQERLNSHKKNTQVEDRSLLKHDNKKLTKENQRLEAENAALRQKLGSALIVDDPWGYDFMPGGEFVVPSSFIDSRSGWANVHGIYAEMDNLFISLSTNVVVLTSEFDLNSMNMDGPEIRRLQDLIKDSQVDIIHLIQTLKKPKNDNDDLVNALAIAAASRMYFYTRAVENTMKEFVVRKTERKTLLDCTFFTVIQKAEIKMLFSQIGEMKGLMDLIDVEAKKKTLQG